MRKGDLELFYTLRQKLDSFRNETALPGIDSASNFDCFTLQLIDSVRRIKYITTIRDRELTNIYCDTTKPYFDPLRAAVWHIRRNNLDEAFWLVFLATHFGKNRTTGWNLVRGVYGAFNNQVHWSWNRMKTDIDSFRAWLFLNQERLKEMGSFGNHRKYQSIDAYKATGTGTAISSYVEWISEYKNHQGLINDTRKKGFTEPKETFNYLYGQLNKVASFGRTAKFDFLTMVGKLRLIDIEPDSAYMDGATGPKTGARLLFGGSNKIRR